MQEVLAGTVKRYSQPESVFSHALSILPERESYQPEADCSRDAVSGMGRRVPLSSVWGVEKASFFVVKEDLMALYGKGGLG